MEYDYEVGLEHDDNWRAGVIASSIRNTMRNKRSDKVWTPYDMDLGIRDPRKVNHQPSKPINRDEWLSYKDMLKKCGKVKVVNTNLSLKN